MLFKNIFTHYPLYLFGIISLFLIVGCGGGSSKNNTSFDCPTISDNINWTSFGRFIFKQSGNDSTARSIISECGWHVYNNHNGGIGDTLQVASINEDVILVWAFNQFTGFKLSKDWAGQTEKGIKIGSVITDLYAQYPGFTTLDGITHLLVQATDIRVSVTSDINGFVSTVLVGFYFRN